MKKDKERTIPIKNYLILGVILILTLGLVYYFYLWYINYEESKLNETIMDRYLEVINYNELNDYIIENRNAMIYTSVLEDNNIRKFEIKFKNTIVRNSLKEKLLYMDMTDIFKDKIKYTLNLTLTKKDKKWVLNDISESDRQKLHGLYNS